VGWLESKMPIQPLPRFARFTSKNQVKGRSQGANLCASRLVFFLVTA
jgi:hypothetical protein